MSVLPVLIFAAILTREHVRFREGDSTGSVTGVRADPEDAFRARQILLEGRRGKPPGAFLTREESRWASRAMKPVPPLRPGRQDAFEPARWLPG